MVAKINTFRDLLVWQKSMKLVTELYRVTSHFPQDEKYGLTSQIRRCSVSIPSNIAEGFGRRSTKEYVRFLNVAIGSLFELQTQLEIAKDLEFLQDGAFDAIYENSREIERMLSNLIFKLKRRDPP